MERAFVIGHPISHSKSPILHRHWLQKYDLGGTYEAVDVEPADLVAFTNAIKSGAFIGGNVTIPHKEAVMALCEKLSATATQIGAVNTLWMQNGQLHGDNTDKYGFLANLDQQLPEWDVQNSVAIVLGAGGAARAILVGLIERGYQTIYVLNRTAERALRLCAELNTVFQTKIFSPTTLHDFNKLAPNADLIVNASSIGMNNTKFEHVDPTRAPKHAIITDIIYTPLETPLLADARRAGLRTIDGVGMLLHQAVPGFERWFGLRPRVTQQLRDKILDGRHD